MAKKKNVLRVVNKGSDVKNTALKEPPLAKNRSYPWEALLICIMLPILMVFNDLSLKYEIKLSFAFYSASIFIALCFYKANRQILKDRATPVLLILIAHNLLYLAGTFYGAYPKFALQEFFLNAGGLFIFLAAYVCFLRGRENIEKCMGYFSTGVGIVSLICIELATSRYLLPVFEWMADLFGSKLPEGYASFEANTRITTVMNPNVFAPIAIIGAFMALWRCYKAGRRSPSGMFYMGVSAVNLTAFLLCFSMGTILAYVLALICAVFLSQKDGRKRVLFLNGYCLIFSIIGAAAAFALRDKGLLAVLSVILISAAAAYLVARLKPVRFPAVGKAGYIALAAIVLAACAAGVLASSLRGPCSLETGESLRRAVKLSGGTYGLQITTDKTQAESVRLEISSMSYTEAALKEKTVLQTVSVKSGDTAEFTVPDSAAAVFFNFTAEKGLTLENAQIKGTGETLDIPLRYLLVPEFVVNRMQGFWVNDNAMQRFVFFRDGIRLGMTSPVIGLGGGAYEGGLFKVADYYYETNHTHNHFIQSFIDGGFIGLLLFIGLAVFLLTAVFKARKTGDDAGLLPFLGACVLLIFIHALIEVDFSSPAFKLTASLMFALTAALYEKDIRIKGNAKFLPAAAIIILVIASLALSIGRMAAVSSLSEKVSLESLNKAVLLDPFNSDDYKLSYLINTMENESSPVKNKAQSYLTSLERKKLSADYAILLSQYYLLKPEPDVEKGIKLAEYYVDEKRVYLGAWDGVFALYSSALDNSDSSGYYNKISDSVKKLCAKLKEQNSVLPKTVNPDYIEYLYIRAGLSEEEKSGGVAADSRVACDLDGNGTSDIKNDSGWSLVIANSKDKIYELKIYGKQGDKCAVSINGVEQTCIYNAKEGCYTTEFFSSKETDFKLLISSGSKDAYFILY